MGRTIGLLAALALLAGSPARAQEAAALIEKLRSKDADEADNARTDLLKMGEKALQPLREAASKSEDAAFKKALGALADRLETRKAAGGLAKAWGDRWFSLFISAVHTGWVHIKMEDKDGQVLLSSEVHVQANKDTTYQVRTSVTGAADEYLTLSQVALDIASPETTVSATARVKDGRLVVKTGGEVKAHKVQSNTVVDLAVFPLVTILPRTEGYEVEIFPLIKPKLPMAAVIKHDREETIEFEGRKVKTRRFILADGESPDRFYYVDAANRLLRVQMTSDDQKDVEILLSDEKRAKDIDTKD